MLSTVLAPAGVRALLLEGTSPLPGVAGTSSLPVATALVRHSLGVTLTQLVQPGSFVSVDGSVLSSLGGS